MILLRTTTTTFYFCLAVAGVNALIINLQSNSNSSSSNNNDKTTTTVTITLDSNNSANDPHVVLADVTLLPDWNGMEYWKKGGSKPKAICTCEHMSV